MRAEIYLEGGGPPGTLTNIRCREGFARLFERCGLDSSKFNPIACGGRGDAWNDFQDAHADAAGEYYVAMLIDSERTVVNTNETWKHLENHDNWQRPPDAQNDQVLFMTTCMETWIVADRSALLEQFDENLQSSQLPALDNLEELRPGNLEDSLKAATQFCPEPYSKGQVSFEVLSKLNPDVLQERLPSFRRARRILNDKLG